MTALEVNVPLLRKSVEWAEAEAAKGHLLSEWYQGQWVVKNPATYEFLDGPLESTGGRYTKSPECGTCFCIAGFTVANELGEEAVAEMMQNPYSNPYGVFVNESAANLLGLNPQQASRLFDACNDIEDVRAIAEEIAGERL